MRSQHHIVCPLCEPGELHFSGAYAARCDEWKAVLNVILKTLQEIIALPAAFGTYACECGRPEMRNLPGRVISVSGSRCRDPAPEGHAGTTRYRDRW
jgi:hypothetical protein